MHGMSLGEGWNEKLVISISIEISSCQGDQQAFGCKGEKISLVSLRIARRGSFS